MHEGLNIQSCSLIPIGSSEIKYCNTDQIFPIDALVIRDKSGSAGLGEGTTSAQSLP